MKVNIDLKLLANLMGFGNSVYILWECILHNKTDEERTKIMEELIGTYLSMENPDEDDE